MANLSQPLQYKHPQVYPYNVSQAATSRPEPRPRQKLKRTPKGLLYINVDGSIVLAEMMGSRGAILRVLQHPTHSFVDATVMNDGTSDVIAASITPKGANWDTMQAPENASRAFGEFNSVEFGVMVFRDYHGSSFNPLILLHNKRRVPTLVWSGASQMKIAMDFDDCEPGCESGVLKTVDVDLDTRDFRSSTPEKGNLDRDYPLRMWGMEYAGDKLVFGSRAEAYTTNSWELPPSRLYYGADKSYNYVVDWDASATDMAYVSDKNILHIVASQHGVTGTYRINSRGVKIAINPEDGFVQAVVPEMGKVARIDARNTDGLGAITVPHEAVRSLRGLGREERVQDMRFAKDGSLWVLTSRGLRELQGFAR